MTRAWSAKPFQVYNLQEDDFDTLRQFNDYLERVEDIVFRLANEVDLDAAEAELKAFREQQADKIERNRKRPSKDDLWIRAQLAEEQSRRRKLQDEHAKEAERGQAQAMFDPRAIIDELMASDLPAEVVLDRQRKKQIEHDMAEKEEAERRKRDRLEEKQRAKDRAFYGTVRPSGKPYVHVQPQLPLNGPPLPSDEELLQLGYLQHIRQASVAALGGGFETKLGCQRALVDAHADLFAF